MRLRLIVNPIASGVTEPLIERVADVLHAVADVEVARTARTGHAVELAGQPGADVVVGMGGDGTANEVVNGIPLGVSCGFLPAGATSVFMRQLGFPNHPFRAAQLLARSIAQGETRSVGLGALDGRRFTFSAGMGLDAEAMRLVGERRAGRADARRPGDFEVLKAALRALRRDGYRLPDRMTVEAGGQSRRCSYLAVANQHPYTYLGPWGIRAAPKASFATALDAVVIGRLGTRHLWRLPVYGLVWPHHARGRDRRVAYLHNVDHLSVTCDGPVAVQLDGEYLGRFQRVEIRYQPAAVSVYVPVPAGSRPPGTGSGR
jgi:diacylglycerol kinase family enzyme